MKGLALVNLFAAAWLIATSWMMPGGIGSSRLTLNDPLVALVLVVLAGWTMATEDRHPVLMWLQLLAGVWLVLAPFVFRYSPWNDVAMGLMVASIAVLELPYEMGRRTA